MRTGSMCFSILQVPRCGIPTLATFWRESFHSLSTTDKNSSSFRLLCSNIYGLERSYNRKWTQRPVFTNAEGRNKTTQQSKLSNIGHEILDGVVSKSDAFSVNKTELSQFQNIEYCDIRQKIAENKELASLVTVIVFDIETTGFSRENERIIEIALRDLEGGENSTFQTLVNPQRFVPNSHVHGITTRMVNKPDVPRMEDLIPILLQFVRSRQKPGGYVVLAAHNARSFDVIADIDNDGVSEMIVAVSYFFDQEYYADSEHLKELGGIDIGKYIAADIVAINLDTKQVKWTTELDLSTDTGDFRAYIYSSPTVADLDGDGYMDILVGTSFGLFYVMDHHGKVREKFPLEMAEIQGAVVAADINDDGKIELVTADTHGNVAAWTTKGEEIWEVHLKSLVPQGPTVGDVDGDGHTDVVIPTLSGNVYVLSGKDGSNVRPYPYRTHGRVMNQVLLVDLNKRGEKKKGLTLVTTSFDGYLYLIDGPTSCADVVDIGETSYSMVLAENVDGGDDLDLIVTTMNGNVFCFSTPSPHHPLKAWRSTNQGRNNVANRHNREGIYVPHPSRAFRDEEGRSFWVDIEIVDKYRFPSGSQAPYNVTTTLLVPGNYQGERRIKQNQIFDRPGKHRIKLPTVGVRTTGTVLVEMVDKNGLYFSDDFSLTFHMYYYKLLKWLLVLPMLGMFGVLLILRPQEAMPLPSFSRNTDL